MRQVGVHYRSDICPLDMCELILQIQKLDRPSSLEYHDVFLDGDKIGTYWRDPNHVTHQVFDHIRYDNKPRTWFKRVSGFEERHSELWRDSRVEALVDILNAYSKMNIQVHTAHAKNRAPKWMTCGVCDG